MTICLKIQILVIISDFCSFFEDFFRFFFLMKFFFFFNEILFFFFLGNDKNLILFRNENCWQLLTKLLSFEHKCIRNDCKQELLKVKTMQTLISKLIQLNNYYLNKINKFKFYRSQSFDKQKQQLFQLIAINENLIEENLTQINDNKRKSLRVRKTHEKYFCDQNNEDFEENEGFDENKDSKKQIKTVFILIK